MANHVRTTPELWSALAEQRRFLRTSSQAFDDGQEAEARRLASTAHILVHDNGRRTKSLLGQLGLKAKLKFVSTVNPLQDGDKIMRPAMALGSVTILPNGQAVLLPHCNFGREPLHRKELSFADWWEEPIFREAHWKGRLNKHVPGRLFTRKNLVMQLRDQDGGSHFDAELDSGIYVDVAIHKRIGMYRQLSDGTSVPFDESPHLLSMRQIAWEIEETLRPVPGGPDLPPWEPFPPKRYGVPADAVFVGGTLTVVPPSG